MQKELQPVVKYFQSEFPSLQSVILHGSRAKSLARPNSDWDFIILTKTKESRDFSRQSIDSQNIEFRIFQIPIKTEKIVDIFHSKLRDAQVVFDTDDVGVTLLNQTQEIYKKGFESYSPIELRDHLLYFEAAIGGLKDSIDEPLMFYKAFTKIYPRIIDMWYQIKHSEFSKNVYEAIPELQERDPYFLGKVSELVEETTPREKKIEILEELVDYLFEGKEVAE